MVESSSHAPYSTQVERSLLDSVVALARHVFGAAASSVFMLSEERGELVFAAVAGEGEESLVGTRIAMGTGIAGWVAASGQTIITDNVADTDHFAKDVAASTGFLPTSIMAAPLVADGECIGVLEVLDRHTVGDAGRELDDMELLGLLASQAALSLDLLRRSERGGSASRRMGSLIARLSEHAAMDADDPLAVALLGVSLELLDRASPSGG
ncbi:GAF domain-containing protein [Actinospica robiniae]|uniref:GAF domain-containing protein n=1 Tax=Actinospica robiniae TaxID=304901 RepID=UPI00054D3E2B|nr:GAF domain-containing protein [Actinospica robiniae]